MALNRGSDMMSAKRRFPPIWVIYDHPLDHPDKFVVRRWYGLIAETNFMLADTIDEARDIITEAGGRHNLGRSARDDLAIAECWL